VSGGQQLHAGQAGAQQVDGLSHPVGVANGVDFLARVGRRVGEAPGGRSSGWAKRRVGEAPAEPHSCREDCADLCWSVKSLANAQSADQRAVARQVPRAPMSSPVCSRDSRVLQGPWAGGGGQAARDFNCAAAGVGDGQQQRRCTFGPRCRSWLSQR